MSKTTISGNSSRTSDSYFDIDDILATQERIPCKFEVPVYNLGFLDASSESADLAADTKMELPLWLVRALYGRRKHTVSMEMPKQYREGYREILNADASVVDLHKLGPNFYSFGSYLLGFDHPEGTDIARCLLTSFQVRLRGIMDSSQNSYNIDVTAVVAKLDEQEKLVFEQGQLGLADFQRWETRQTEKLTSSKMVQQHRKRKRQQMEN